MRAEARILGICAILLFQSCGIIPEPTLKSAGPIEFGRTAAPQPESGSKPGSADGNEECVNPFRSIYSAQPLNGLLKARFRKLRLVSAGAYVELRPSKDKVDGGAAVEVKLLEGTPISRFLCRDFSGISPSRYLEMYPPLYINFPIEIDAPNRVIRSHGTLFIPTPGSAFYQAGHKEPSVELYDTVWPVEEYGKHENIELHARAELQSLERGDVLELIQSWYDDNANLESHPYNSLRFLIAKFEVTE